MKSRVRWKIKPTNPLEGVGHHHQFDGTTTVPCDGHFMTAQMPHSKLEIIGDIVGNPRGFNPAYHQKYIGALKPLTFEEFLPQDERRRSLTYGTSGLVCQEISSLLSDYAPFVDPQELDDFGAQAEHHFVTAVDPTGSLMNIIIETAELLEGNILVLRSYFKKISVAMERYKAYLIRKPGELWLAWNFCIRPMIGDLEHMVKSLERAQKRAKWLRNRNHRPTTVHYRQRLKRSGVIPLDRGPLATRQTFQNDEEAGTIWYCQAPFWGDSTVGSFELRYDADVTLAATGLVRFDIPDEYLCDDFWGIGTVWSAIQGLYNPAAIIWEATPFSWLIDYFLAQRERLKMHNLKISPLPDARILASCHSVKVVLRGEVVFRCGSWEQSLGPVHNKLYIRRVGMPAQTGALFTLPIRWQQFANITAVLAVLGIPPDKWGSNKWDFGSNVGVFLHPH